MACDDLLELGGVLGFCRWVVMEVAGGFVTDPKKTWVSRHCCICAPMQYGPTLLPNNVRRQNNVTMMTYIVG